MSSSSFTPASSFSPAPPTLNNSVDVSEVLHKLSETTVENILTKILSKEDLLCQPSPQSELPRHRPEVFSKRISSLEGRVKDLSALLETRTQELMITRQKLSLAEVEMSQHWKETQLTQRAVREATGRAEAAEGALTTEQDKVKRLETDKKNLVRINEHLKTVKKFNLT